MVSVVVYGAYGAVVFYGAYSVYGAYGVCGGQWCL